MFTLAQRGGIDHLAAANLAALPGVTHAFCARRGGASAAPFASLNTGFLVGDRRPDVLENLARTERAFGVAAGRLLLMGQVHGDTLRVVDAGPLPPSPLPECDGLVTDRPGVALGIRTADCVPVLFADPVRRVVGAAHAGWRGTALGIAAAVVDLMARRYGSRPEDLHVAIGPAIGPCCYEVDAPVQAAFAVRWDVAPFLRPGGVPDRWRLDLAAANRQQLLERGVPAGRILAGAPCTACRPDLFFSHRGEAGRTGRQINLILLEAAQGFEKRA